MANAHVRQRAIDASKAKLAARCDLFASRVWLTPRSAVSKREVPCAVLAQGDEDAEYIESDRRNIVRSFDLDVIVADINTREAIGSKILSSLNALAAQVEAAMVPAAVDGVGLGCGELDIRYVRTGRPQASALGDDIAEMPITFRIVIPSVEGDPTESIYEQE